MDGDQSAAPCRTSCGGTLTSTSVAQLRSPRTSQASPARAGAEELAKKVKGLQDRYTDRAEVLWKTPDIEIRRKMYFDEMLPTFTEVKDTAQEIIRINQDNMVAADREARALSAQSTRYMIFA